MQLRVRHPAGQAVLTLDDTTATVALLFTSIAQTCAFDVSCISLMSGFPPAPLNVAHDSSASLKDIGLQSGDTLIVKAKQADVNKLSTIMGLGLRQDLKPAGVPRNEFDADKHMRLGRPEPDGEAGVEGK